MIDPLRPQTPVSDEVAAAPQAPRDRMADQVVLYRRHAEEATRRAGHEGLENVRVTHLRAAQRWTDMADDLDRVARLRAHRTAGTAVR